jgi:hypothetical protein
VEEPHVTQAVAVAYLEYPRFHDLYEALTWRLARDPFPSAAVQIAPDTYILRSVTWEYEGFCTITMIYTVGFDEVCIEEIKAEPP